MVCRAGEGPPKVAARRTRGNCAAPASRLSAASSTGYIAVALARLPLELPADAAPYAPAAERTLSVFGAAVQLALLPGRRARSGHDREGRAAFVRSPAERILDEETSWRAGGLALTPNRYPFARDQHILWMARPAREPDREFWQVALDWVERSDGTALLNNIGAAATIPRAHAHLIGERLPFLANLPERELRDLPIDVPDGCQLVAKDLPFCVLGVRGAAVDRAEALLRLADACTTATWNVVLTRDAAWVVPRGEQTPAPWFPAPLGAAELWGRFCYTDEQPFARATAEDLEAALVAATRPAID